QNRRAGSAPAVARAVGRGASGRATEAREPGEGEGRASALDAVLGVGRWAPHPIPTARVNRWTEDDIATFGLDVVARRAYPRAGARRSAKCEGDAREPVRVGHGHPLRGSGIRRRPETAVRRRCARARRCAVTDRLRTATCVVVMATTLLGGAAVRAAP